MFLRISTITILAVSFTCVDGAFGMEGEAKAHRFIKTHCIRCHGEETQEAKVALHEASFESIEPENMALWIEVLEQLKTGEMPPPDEENQPSNLERHSVIEWIDRKLQKLPSLCIPLIGTDCNGDVGFDNNACNMVTESSAVGPYDRHRENYNGKALRLLVE